MNSLQTALLEWYARCGREQLPWRRTRDPYAILVSELMLQQTQVDRALQRYADFLRRYPTFQDLAAASTADVLRSWRGLGYNSRAVRLRRIACEVVERFGGVMPRDVQTLRSLPGIGPYTVAALRAFAFDCDDAAVDTNVRRVVHRAKYGLEYPPAASAAEARPCRDGARPAGTRTRLEFGSHGLGCELICTARAPKCPSCPLQPHCAAAPIDPAVLERARAAHSRPSPQERIPFAKSTRFARGRIVDRLRDLAAGERISFLDLHREVCEPAGRTRAEVEAIVRALASDGLVDVRDGTLALRDQ